MNFQDLLKECCGAKDFTLTTYNHILKKGNKSNVVTSPFSVEIIFNLTLLGARGEAAEEIVTTLSYPDNYQEKIGEVTKTVLTALASDDSFILKLANKLYLKQNYEVRDDFRKLATDVFRSDLEGIDFENVVEAAGTINEWVKKQTDDKIIDLMDPGRLTKWTRVILVNALYFKADWLTPFTPSLTYERNFFKDKNDTLNVLTMETLCKYNYYECGELGAKVLEMPFKGDASMIVVLPNEIEGLTEVENKLDLVLNLKSENFTKELIKLQLPKFKIEANLDFKNVLQKVGIKKVFKVEDADLSGIAGDKGELYVDGIIQKVFIEVGEDGVEAAAASFVEMGVAQCAFTMVSIVTVKEFIVDHPFMFIIKVRGLVLFIGRVTDPTVGKV